MSPAINQQEWVQTWVTSQWKNRPIPGQFSAEINNAINLVKDHSTISLEKARKVITDNLLHKGIGISIGVVLISSASQNAPLIGSIPDNYVRIDLARHDSSTGEMVDLIGFGPIGNVSVLSLAVLALITLPDFKHDSFEGSTIEPDLLCRSIDPSAHPSSFRGVSYFGYWKAPV